MNASRSTVRTIVMIMALSTTLMLRAAEPTAAPATLPAAKPDAAKPDAAKPDAAKADATKPTAAKPATAAPAAASSATPPADTAVPAEEPDRFEATEKVRADFEVSFPVDI